MTATDLSNLVVEVLHNRGDDNHPDWSVGSGFFVGTRLVLTALHNVDGHGELLVRVHGTEEHPAAVRLQGDEDIDLAVLEVPDMEVDIPQLRYGKVDRSAPAVVEQCWAIGFPQFKERVHEPKPLRLSAQVNGEIPTGENLGQPLLTLHVRNSPRLLPGSAVHESVWAGMSGAVVFSGDDIIVGVITEQLLTEGESAFTVVPITALDLLSEAEATKWWKLLGVDRQALVRLPPDIYAEDLLSASGEPSNLSDSIKQETGKTDEPHERLDIAIRALADTPSEIDYLRFADYADALVDFITSEKTQKPLTIAIDAAWGMGKTTLMRMIKSRLEGNADKEKQKSLSAGRVRKQRNALQSTFPIVWFNAWQYDQEDSLWAALVLEILEQVRKQYSLKQKVGFWWDLTQKRLGKRNRFLQVIFRLLPFVAGLLVLATILFAIAWFWKGSMLIVTLKTITLSIAGTIGVFALAYASMKDLYSRLIKPYDQKIVQLYQKLARYVRELNYKDRVGFLAQFKEDFSAIVEAVTSEGKWPLIIFIDDLDRCAPPKPVEIIEAMNLLLDAQHCVFVMGMDIRTVAGSIQAKYKDLLPYLDAIDTPDELTLGYRFLEKIIQITFHLPRADATVVQSFIDTILLGTEQNTVTPPIREQVLEVGQLIEAEQRGGKELDTAAEIVQQARSDISENTLIKAKAEIRAKSFDDSQVVQDVIHQVAPFLELNPRKIKRFINLFRLQALIANRRGLLETGVIKLDLLARWIVISTRWPVMVDALLSEENFVNRLKDARKTIEIMKNVRVKELEGSEKIEERQRLLEGYQVQLDTYKADPHIKLLIDADDLLALMGKLTDADIQALPHYLHLTQMTYQNT